MKNVRFALVLEELRRNLAHERIGAELGNELHPATNARSVGAFGRLLNAIRNRLLTLVAEKTNPV